MTATPAPTSSWEFQLRARLVQRDERALGELYDQFASLVYGLASRVTGSTQAAEDVVQEVFAHVWHRPETFDPGRGSMRSWLGTLAHRRAVDWVRREEANRRRSERQGALPVTPPDVEEMASSLVLAEKVRIAVERLPDDQRTAVLLAYFDGKTYRQVAHLLGIPEGTAKSRLRAALRNIAAAMESEGIESWR
jgi:RNA polymerase sigma factor (sigma-70 family)